MRILHVLDHSLPIRSGYAFRTEQLMRAQMGLGYEVIGLTSDRQQGKGGIFEFCSEIGFYRTASNSFFKKIPLVKHLATVLSLRLQLKRLLHDFKPDILHTHSPSLTALSAYHLGKQYNIPMVYEIRAFWEDAAVDHGTHDAHSMRYRFIRKIDHELCSKMSRVVTICEGLKQDLISRGIHSKKIMVVPNAVDLDRFSLKESKVNLMRLKLGFKDEFILGFMGSFYHYEGIQFLINAFKIALEKNKHLRLFLIGQGPEKASISNQIKCLGLEKEIFLMNSVSHEQVLDWYQMFDLCVYPRHRVRLTDLVTPIKPLEAMAAGRLVLASDVGGHCELIEHGQTGFLFRADSQSDFLLKLNEIVDHFSSCQTMIPLAENYIKLHRNWKNNVLKYKELYEGLF